MSHIPIVTAAEIKELRGNLNLTQEQFAERYRIGLRTLQGWECGARKPTTTASILLRMIKAYPQQIAAEIATMPRLTP